jgi:hypothetical protein
LQIATATRWRFVERRQVWPNGTQLSPRMVNNLPRVSYPESVLFTNIKKRTQLRSAAETRSDMGFRPTLPHLPIHPAHIQRLPNWGTHFSFPILFCCLCHTFRFLISSQRFANTNLVCGLGKAQVMLEMSRSELPGFVAAKFAQLPHSVRKNKGFRFQMASCFDGSKVQRGKHGLLAVDEMNCVVIESNRHSLHSLLVKLGV